MRLSSMMSGALSAAAGLLLLSACGRLERVPMTESAAFDQLSQLPTTSSESASSSTQLQSGTTRPASAQSLSQVLAGLIASGQIRVSGGSNTGVGVNAPKVGVNEVNLELLTQILDMITNGKANNVMALVNAILKAPSLKTGDVIEDIGIIVTVLQAARPVLVTVAPQLVPVVDALITILPTVQSILRLFKPKPTGYIVYPHFVRA